MAKLGGASITREQFLLREMRVACQLKLEGLTDEEIINKIKDENLIQYPTERMVGNIAGVCVKRINALESEKLVQLIANGEPEQAAQANLYAMMCMYPLVRHFMITEVARHFEELDYTLGALEMGAYMTRLQMDYEDMAAVTDATVGKLKQVLRKSLIECGMLANAYSEELIPIFMDYEVREAIEAKGDTEALPAFNCQGGF